MCVTGSDALVHTANFMLVNSFGTSDPANVSLHNIFLLDCNVSGYIVIRLILFIIIFYSPRVLRQLKLHSVGRKLIVFICDIYGAEGT